MISPTAKGGDLPDELVCLVLSNVPPLWRPVASRVCSAWRRCTIEVAYVRARTNHDNDSIAWYVRAATHLSANLLKNAVAFDRSALLDWIISCGCPTDNVVIVEAVARHGLAKAVYSITDSQIRRRGKRGLLGLLDGGVLAGIAIRCGGAQTLHQLCAHHGIKRLDRRNMAWATTIAVIMGDICLLRFLARMQCPYDITTAIAVHVLDDKRTIRLFGIASDMLAYAADIAKRHDHCPELSDTHECLLTKITVLIKRWGKEMPIALADMFADSRRIARIMTYPSAWRAAWKGVCEPTLLCTDDATNCWATFFDRLSGWLYDCANNSEHHPDTWHRGIVGCMGSHCTAWHCHGSQTLDSVYLIDTVGNASVADGMWIPPLFQRWQHYEPALRLLFRYAHPVFSHRSRLWMFYCECLSICYDIGIVRACSAYDAWHRRDRGVAINSDKRRRTRTDCVRGVKRSVHRVAGAIESADCLANAPEYILYGTPFKGATTGSLQTMFYTVFERGWGHEKCTTCLKRPGRTQSLGPTCI